MGAKRPCFKNLSVRGCKLFLLPTLCLVRISGFWLKVNFTGWIFIHFPRILSPQTSGNRTLLFRVIFLIQSQEQGCLGPPNCRMAEGGPHYGLSPVVASIFLVAQTAKCLPTMWETQVRSLGQEDPLEKEMASHSSALAWRIPWTEEPGGLQSMGSQSRTRLSK